MIIPDTNLLIYATAQTAPDHAKARDWWKRCLNGSEHVGLPWHSLTSYLRIMSSSRARLTPTPIDQLLDVVDSWFESQVVDVIDPRAHHMQAMRSIAEPLGLGGDIMNDVHLAALSIEYGGVIHTADADFARFPGVRWLNPLQ